ncbi:MAG: DUF2637 domain-containing protein [Streptosporangiaceae bacterium]
MTDGSIRFLAGLSLAALAAITGIVSYLHALTVVYLTGSSGLVAYLIPFVADLMIVTASLAILDAIRHRAPKPPLAMVSLVTGIGSTLAMNIVAGLHISAGGALVAALPPVAFVLSLETLMGIVRLARAGDGASHLTATDGQCPHQVAMSAEDAIVAAYLHARDCLGEPVSQRQAIGHLRRAAAQGGHAGRNPQRDTTKRRRRRRHGTSVAEVEAAGAVEDFLRGGGRVATRPEGLPGTCRNPAGMRRTAGHHARTRSPRRMTL